jgi:hypothetical protein
MEIAAASEGVVVEDVQHLLERRPLRLLICVRVALVGPARELTADGELEHAHLVAYAAPGQLSAVAGRDCRCQGAAVRGRAVGAFRGRPTGGRWVARRADYVLLIQQRSDRVLNARHNLAVFPRPFISLW